MKSKKGIMVELLLRIIIAIIFLWGAIAIGKSLFRVTSQGEQSFNNLVNLIENVKTEGGTLSMNLIMDQKTAIYGFSKNADEIIRPKRGETPSGKCENDKNCHSFVKRPPSCDKGKVCICYCSKYEAKKVFTDRIGGYEGTCKKPKCFNIDGIDFLSQISEIKLAFYGKGPLLPQIVNPQNIYNGFIFEREKTDSGSWIDGPHGLLAQINMPERSRAIYVENYKGVVSVCAEHPCISDEAKKQIDGKKI